jgi:hypothetical protein
MIEVSSSVREPSGVSIGGGFGGFAGRGVRLLGSNTRTSEGGMGGHPGGGGKCFISTKAAF